MGKLAEGWATCNRQPASGLLDAPRLMPLGLNQRPLKLGYHVCRGQLLNNVTSVKW
ncbi:MAG: hypothetical protein ACI87T_003192 [Planctomycetota bacterium]|jgi:hypothetical protein